MRVSVVTVAFNAAATIADTLESVARQTHPDVESLVIDGGSKDGTQSLVEGFGDVVAHFVSEPDRGLYDAMNKGLRRATGDYVAFLNADDYYAGPDVLAAVAATAARTGADVILGDTIMLSAEPPHGVSRFYSAAGFRPWQFRFGHMPPHPSTFVRRDLLLRLGGFDLRYSISADFDLMLRLFRTLKPRVAHLPKTVTVMRGGGLTTQGLSSNRKINQQVAAVCRDRGVWTHPAIIWSKYAAKAFQLIHRPDDAPAGW